MTHKWIIRGISGSFVKTEDAIEEQFGKEIVSEMKEEVADQDFPQVQRKVENTKIVCVRTF